MEEAWHQGASPVSLIIQLFTESRYIQVFSGPLGATLEAYYYITLCNMHTNIHSTMKSKHTLLSYYLRQHLFP